MNKKQISYNEVDGKTIDKVCTEYGTNTILTLFTDGTFSLLNAYYYDTDDDVIIEDDNFYLECWLKYSDELIRLGIVTPEQVEVATAKAQSQAAREKEYRLKEYLRLKAEFEKE